MAQSAARVVESQVNSPIFNIATYLPEMAAKRPEGLALALPVRRTHAGQVEYRKVSYRELNQESDWVAHALTAAGIERGMPTALMVKPGPEFFALTFAMAKIGAVPVIVDPGIGPSKVKLCLAEAEPIAFIGIPKAHVARALLGWGRSSLRHLIVVGPWAPPGSVTLNSAKRRVGGDRGPFTPANTRESERAAILFTSGSTGPPKGAVYTHGNFKAQVDTLRRVSGVKEGEVDMPTLPVFALFDPALGMSTIVPDMDPTRPASVDPRHLASAIEQFGVTNMFASPAVLNVLAQYATDNNIRLPSLKRVVCAGAPVQAAIMDRCLSMMGENARIVTPYGATEALPVCAVDSSELLQEETRNRTASGGGVLVGKPVAEVKMSIIKMIDGEIPELSPSLLVEQGNIGEIVVEGAMVTESYQGRPDSTRLAKIRTEDGIAHRMGDVGYFDDVGRLWFCGRLSHRVRTPAETLFSVPCEMILNEHSSVYRSALVAIEVAGETTAALCIETEASEKKIGSESLRRELLSLASSHQCTQHIRYVFFHPDFPVDIRHNAKIDRASLGAWAQRQLG